MRKSDARIVPPLCVVNFVHAGTGKLMMTANRSIAAVAEHLASAQCVACLTGAGVSAESGIATFRKPETGLWSAYNPQQLASQAGFAADPGLVWRWYMMRLAAVEAAAPNPGHVALGALESLLPTWHLITQNVDNLHERGGSTEVIHLHGSIAHVRCNRCARPHTLTPSEREDDAPPPCIHCGGLIRPAVVWFGELLPDAAIAAAHEAAATCDVMLVVGTSGVVYPAAQLPVIAKAAGAVVVDINPEHGPLSELAEIHLPGPSGDLLPQLVDALKTRLA